MGRNASILAYRAFFFAGLADLDDLGLASAKWE
jgi:hypothetical protein